MGRQGVGSDLGNEKNQLHIYNINIYIICLGNTQKLWIPYPS